MYDELGLRARRRSHPRPRVRRTPFAWRPRSDTACRATPCSCRRLQSSVTVDGRFRLPEHVFAAEDLPQTLRGLGVAGYAQHTGGCRRRKADLPGGDICPVILVGCQDDGGILSQAVMKLDRPVVDCEVKGRAADEELVALADSLGGLPVSQARHRYRRPARPKGFGRLAVADAPGTPGYQR